eukprot:gnl/MRDRNA2_/MRDRNA2_27797_c0_seq2.p1 gnl/MRDRNA2_/MRDRNA2_27797_c0~~gnl/MRDRNA2_/MRDRNA2_27797_c0_seq2.p1  ORF type:complete len:614 (+),score=110.13 gnl/MRDRNA2_/MRDRNA2_27797_c0_seq2:82-1923(+)
MDMRGCCSSEQGPVAPARISTENKILPVSSVTTVLLRLDMIVGRLDGFDKWRSTLEKKVDRNLEELHEVRQDIAHLSGMLFDEDAADFTVLQDGADLVWNDQSPSQLIAGKKAAATSTFYSRQGTMDAEKTAVQGLACIKGWTNMDLGERVSTKGTLNTVAVKMKNSWQRLIQSSVFENLCVVLIVMNAVLLGYQVQHMAVKSTSDPPEILTQMQTIFTIVFLVELLARISVSPYEWACGEGWSWNWFDLVVVVSSLLELILQTAVDSESGESGTGGNLSLFRVLRILRIVRVVRFIRVFRFFRELRMMVSSIMGSFKSLLWAILLLFIILYIVGMYLTQIVTEYKTGPDSDPNLVHQLQQYYGTLFESMYYLFQTMTGGVSWGDMAKPLMGLHWSYAIFMSFFTSFIMFAVLNIVTGVFVEGAIGKAQSEKDEKIRHIMEEETHNMQELEQVFNEIDADSSGHIDLEELETLLKDPRVKAYFKTIGLHVAEAHALFRLLDLDDSNTVSISEFIMGCARLKGEAKSIDLATLMYENKRMMVKWAKFMHFMQDQLADIRAEMHRIGSSRGRIGLPNPGQGASKKDYNNFDKMLTVNGTSAWSPRGQKGGPGPSR